jgi:hypothetical protein
VERSAVAVLLALGATVATGGVIATGDAMNGTQTAIRTATDRDDEVRFRLDGRTLTATIAHQPNVVRTPTIEEDLFGKRVRASCGTLHGGRGGTVVSRIRRWPDGETSLDYRFRRDISARAKWCLLEDREGGDIAVVRFRKR